MGGNATLEFGTKRIDKKDYEHIADVLSLRIFSNKGDLRIKNEQACIIPSYRQKADFGDMDILSTMPANEAEKFFSDLVIGKKKNGNVTSFAIEVDGIKFQLDWILSSKKDFDFSYYFFSYNDLGNLIGRIASRFGLKFGHDGLFAKYYFNNGVRSTKQLSNSKVEIPFNFSFFQALSYLGLDPVVYIKGFDTKEDIFNFVANSHFFHPSFFDISEMNSDKKRRDRKRTILNEFRAFTDNLKDQFNEVSIHKIERDFNARKVSQVVQKYINERKLEKARINAVRRYRNTFNRHFNKADIFIGALPISASQEIKREMNTFIKAQTKTKALCDLTLKLSYNELNQVTEALFGKFLKDLKVKGMIG